MTTKTYIGPKTVIAKPMTRAVYNEYRSWTLPLNENGADEGYLVEYVDGGSGNDSRHLGYISWSPKDVFERSYKVAPVTYQDRLVAELDHETDKLEKLNTFMGTDFFLQLPSDKRARLLRQAGYMVGLVSVLHERIHAGD